MPSSLYHAVAGAVAGGLVGERIAFECSAHLCAHAPDENARRFLATQVLDEARHVEVFENILHRMGFEDLDATLRKYVGNRMFEFQKHMRHRVCESRDFVGGVIGQNLALEGLALGFFEFYMSLLQASDPGTAQVFETVLQDERRHVGFGLVRLQELCEKSPAQKAYVHDTLAELSAEMMEVFEDNAEQMDKLGIDAGAAMNRVRQYHVSHLQRIGVGVESI